MRIMRGTGQMLGDIFTCCCEGPGGYCSYDPDERRQARKAHQAKIAAKKSALYRSRQVVWFIDSGVISSGSIDFPVAGDDGKMHYIVISKDQRQYCLPQDMLYPRYEQAQVAQFQGKAPDAQTHELPSPVIPQMPEMRDIVQEHAALKSAQFRRGQNAFLIETNISTHTVVECKVKDVSVSSDCKVFYTVLTVDKAEHFLPEDRLYKSRAEGMIAL